MSGEVRIEQLADPADADVHAMLVELALDEQEHYDHPQRSRASMSQSTRPVSATFTGENVVYVARGDDGVAVGLVWCALFDPGTGLEGEIAEVYVRPDARGRGIASALCARAMALFREREVTFACVWTRDNNPAALAAYRRAGFLPTEQVVLTWLPVDDPDSR